MTQNRTRTALVTGGSQGLGLELVRLLVADDWHVVTDARDADTLHRHLADLPAERITALPGDLTDPGHRKQLVDAVEGRGGLDLLVLNASTLGPLPMRPLRELTHTGLEDTFRGTATANAALMISLTGALLRRDGVVVGLSSDAAVEHYPTWGPYGAAKAALDHLVLTFGEETGLAAYAVDPGDMRTRMHQDAFPGEDISDRPLPATVAPRLIALVSRRPASGRHRAAEVVVDDVVGTATGAEVPA